MKQCNNIAIMASPFKERIISIIRSVPKGTVVSYGQVAAYAGLARAARQVGFIMREMEEDVPWWRVVNNAGRISIEGNWNADKPLQSKLLLSEGVVVSDDFTFDIEAYRFRPTTKQLKAFQLEEAYITMLIEKFGV